MADQSNILVHNSGSDPLVNFNFMLRIELATDVPCKSVRAFQRELEFDQIQEGGLNDYVHMLRKPISRPFTLEIERYAGTDYFDPLPLGADFVLPLLLFVSRSPAQFIPGVTARTYVFHGCTVIKKSYGDLVADQSGLLVETITIAYREMLCVDVPWAQVGDNIMAPPPTYGHSAKTLSTEPEELQVEGQRLYEDANAAVSAAAAQYRDGDVTTLVTELETLKKTLESALNVGGLLQKQATNAKNTLNGTNKSSIKPLFDIVNDRKATVMEKKKALRDEENALRTLLATEARIEGAVAPAVQSKQEAVETAKAELQAAQDSLDTAQYEATKAQKELVVAEGNLKKAKDSVHSLANTINNLKLRTDSVKEARGKYGESLSSCRSANEKLQKYSAANAAHHSDIRTEYQNVKKHHDDAVMQTRKVGEAESYRESGEKLQEETHSWWATIAPEEEIPSGETV